jgi:hypothetical protein
MGAPSNYIVLEKAKLNILAQALLNAGNTFKLSLHTSAFTPNDASNEVYADLANELATGNGYTSGGITLSGVSLTLIPAKTISSITFSGQTATVTTSSAHGLASGMIIPVTGATDALYNGSFKITVTGSTTFTYTMTGTPVANASGSLAYSGVVTFSHTAATWTASSGSIPAWRYAYLRAVGTFGGKVDPLIARFVGDSTPADVPATTAGNTLTVNPPAAGIVAYA